MDENNDNLLESKSMIQDNASESVEILMEQSNQDFDPSIFQTGRKINHHLLIRNTIRFLIDGLLILISSMIDLWVNLLIYNVILLFSLRRLILRGTEIIVITNLYVIELFIFIQIIVINIIYILRRTKVKYITENNNMYDSRGFLRFSVIHEYFWNNKSISFSNPSIYKSKMAPVSYSPGISGEEMEISNTNIIRNIASEVLPNHSEIHDNDEIKINDRDDACQMKIDNSLNDEINEGCISDDSNDKGKQYHFPFNYKKSKKKEKLNGEMDAFETFITDKLNEIPIPGSKMSIKSNIFK